MKVYNITIPIYADNENEAQEASKALFDFVNGYRMRNIAVTGAKITKALNKINGNAFVKTQIDNFLKY